MKKLDRRIVRTRQALADGLIRLSLVHGYENLSIRTVTEHAGVGYRTFYRHYLSLDDLLKEILRSAFQELKRQAFEADSPDGETLAMYTFVRDHPDVLRVYVNLPWEHPARQAIVSDATKLGHARYAQQNSTTVPLDISIDHLVIATNNLIAWYLDRLDGYTPEQAMVIHNDLVVKSLEHRAIDLRDDYMEKRHQIR